MKGSVCLFGRERILFSSKKELCPGMVLIVSRYAFRLPASRFKLWRAKNIGSHQPTDSGNCLEVACWLPRLFVDVKLSKSRLLLPLLPSLLICLGSGVRRDGSEIRDQDCRDALYHDGVITSNLLKGKSEYIVSD